MECGSLPGSASSPRPCVQRVRAATESPFGATIAHGFLTLSLLSHLHGQAVRVVGDQKMTIIIAADAGVTTVNILLGKAQE